MTAPATIAAAGPIEHSLFAVPGMHCASCIARLEAGLAALPGVIAARANFTNRQLAVDHSEQLSEAEIKEAIAAIGYESVAVGAAALGDRSESRALLRATAVAGFAAMNVMLLSVSVWSGATGGTRDLFHLVSAIIAIPAIAYAGRPFFRSAWAALSRGRTNMDVPISLGVTLVTALSLFETLTHGAEAYFDGAVMLLFFLLVGRLLDNAMRERARSGVAALLRQTAPGARVVGAGGATEWLAADALKPGMTMLVAAGERLAADGRIESGESALDLSLLTGESAPQLMGMGDTVHAGTLNLDAPLTVRVTAAGPDTALADIARLMEQAGQGRSRYVRIADRAARWYAPAVHLLALGAFVGWLLAGAGWHQALLIAAAVLIITCPCALGLAVPAAQIVAAGTLLRRGVLVKDGSALERFAEVDRALFDKTGTLTLGRPEVVNLEAIPHAVRPAVLALARASSHPLSVALRRALEAEGVRPAALTGLAEQPGFGMRGRWDGCPVSLGRPANHAQCQMVVAFVADDSAPVTIRFQDALRPEAAATIRRLEAMGIGCAIASGDHAAAVAPVVRALELRAETGMRPQDKLDAIARLTAEGHKVLMVGDGLNDGPALAAGHASLAPASASDVGQNAADAVFLGDSLAPVATAILVARRTLRVVRQNFGLAIAYNACAVPLALLGLVTPLVAAIAMSSSSLLVVGNALRLRGAAR